METFICSICNKESQGDAGWSDECRDCYEKSAKEYTEKRDAEISAALITSTHDYASHGYPEILNYKIDKICTLCIMYVSELNDSGIIKTIYRKQDTQWQFDEMPCVPMAKYSFVFKKCFPHR